MQISGQVLLVTLIPISLMHGLVTVTQAVTSGQL